MPQPLQSFIQASIEADGSCYKRDISVVLPVMELRPGGQDDVPDEDVLFEDGAEVFDDENYLNLFRTESRAGAG